MTLYASLQTQHAAPASHRHARFEGREHLVVPCVPIVAGVLNGYLVPAEEIAQFVEAWNGIPLPLGHPHEHGQAVSANSPRQVEQAVGRFFNAHMDGDRLVGELWIDVAKCHQLGGDALEVLRRLEAGEPLELSTAFWAETEPAEGEFHGQAYHGIHRHLRPDHLALLPRDVGACSWADGCGAPRVASRHERPGLSKQGEPMDERSFAAAVKAFVAHCFPALAGPHAHVLSEARRPRFTGTESTAWTAPTFEDYVAALFEGEDPPARVQDASPALKRAIAAHTLLGDPEADDFRDLSFFPVVNPRTRRLNEQALRAVLGGRAAQADIPAAARESAQAMARRLLNSEFDAGLEPNRLRTQVTDADIREALQAALAREAAVNGMFAGTLEAIEGRRVIYRQGQQLLARSFTVTPEGAIHLLADVEEVTRDTRFHPVGKPAGTVGEEDRMDAPMDAQAVQQQIAALVSTPGSGWSEADRPLLQGLCAQAIARLHAHMLAQQAALQAAKAEPTPPKPVTLDEWLAQLPEEPRQLVTQALEAQKRQRQEITEAILQADGSPWTAEELQAMSLSQLLKLKRSLHREAADYRAQGLPAASRAADDKPLQAPQTMTRVLEIQRQRGLIR